MLFGAQRYGSSLRHSRCALCVAREQAAASRGSGSAALLRPTGRRSPDSSRAARSGGVRCALRAHRRLLCDRGTREIWRAEAAERLSAAERRLKKILGPWGTGRTRISTEDGKDTHMRAKIALKSRRSHLKTRPQALFGSPRTPHELAPPLGGSITGQGGGSHDTPRCHMTRASHDTLGCHVTPGI